MGGGGDNVHNVSGALAGTWKISIPNAGKCLFRKPSIRSILHKQIFSSFSFFHAVVINSNCSSCNCCYTYLTNHFFSQFMSITYVLQVAWLLMLCFLVIVTLIFTIFWSLCANTDVQNNKKCIDFRQFGECFRIVLLSFILLLSCLEMN